MHTPSYDNADFRTEKLGMVLAMAATIESQAVEFAAKYGEAADAYRFLWWKSLTAKLLAGGIPVATLQRCVEETIDEDIL